MSELSNRLIVAAVGIPLALILIYFGNFPFFIGVLAISSIALLEYYSLAERKGFAPFKWLGLLITLLLQSAFFAQFSNAAMSSPFMAGVLLFTAFVIATLIAATLFRQENAIANTAITIFGVTYVSSSFITLYIIREFNSFLSLFNVYLKSHNMIDNNAIFQQVSSMSSIKWGYYIFIIFASIWLCDSAAYFFGKSFGKHKLHPRVSPKKTIEGAVAGLAFAVLAFALLGYYLVPEIPLIHNIVAGVIVGVLGQIGDLAESLLKRDACVKDSSNILPGHGGLLDRFDSILFVAPSLFVYLCVIIYFNFTI